MAESDRAHNFAYHPSVANWVQSTSLAHLDAAPAPADVHGDLPTEVSPDEFYRAAYASPHHDDPVPPPLEMAAAVRPRQPTVNGTPRALPKQNPRAVSGPASSVTSRSSSRGPNKVKALAERFERSPGAGSAAGAPPVRSRSREPTRAGAHEPVRRPLNTSLSSSPSAARQSKEAAYGAYKFSNLKPRERPQPAPATPRSARRTHSSKGSIEHQTHTTTSPRRPTSSGRQLFFGEVLSGQDVTSPGFGIPVLDSAAVDGGAENSPAHPTASSFESSLRENEPQLSSAANGHVTHRRGGSVPSSQRRSPSRIPIATRRSSAASDTSSSTRSVKYTPTRISNRSNRASPTGAYRKQSGPSSGGTVKGSEPATLPALAYRGYRERGKSPIGAGTAPNVPVVVAAPPAPSPVPSSPRLRHSRDRQPLQPSPSPSAPAKGASVDGDQGYFGTADGLVPHHEAVQTMEQATDSGIVHYTMDENQPEGLHSVFSQGVHQPLQHSQQPDISPDPGVPRRLSVQTSSLTIPPAHEPASAITDFEESPVLGMPGSFILTPPTAHEEREEGEHELLKPAVFHQSIADSVLSTPNIEQSELGVRESIPIMLSEESPTEPWQTTPVELSGGLQALTYGTPLNPARDSRDDPPNFHSHASESPTHLFSNRDSLYPDDSISVAPYRAAQPMQISQETYTVVNSILNLYHQSPVISPELATVSRQRVQQVSPVIAQHKNWASKEATETYLARLLSDANSQPDEADFGNHEPLSVAGREIVPVQEERSEEEAGGTAIIYPSQSQSQRYSRGSEGSTATTILDDASRSASPFAYVNSDQQAPSSDADRKVPHLDTIELPQLAWTNSGLGLSLNNNLSPSPTSSNAPPRPLYSPPPPPPNTLSIEQQSHAPQISASVAEDRELSQFSTFESGTDLSSEQPLTPVDTNYDANADNSDSDSANMPWRTWKKGKGDAGSKKDEVVTPVPVVNAIPPDPAKQALIKRYRILEELLTTEHQFGVDMMIAHRIFEATAPQSIMNEKERKALFSNCKELEKFSHSLFRALKKAARSIVVYETPPSGGQTDRTSSGTTLFNIYEAAVKIPTPVDDAQAPFQNCTLENDHQTTIGAVFLENKDKMERLYTTYFLNQENASAYIKKNASNPELAGWVMACFEQVENLTQAWDLDSLLLKPCQRLLKYPLLLEGLEQASDANHPDLENIRTAKKALLAVSARINESKKRADTFRAATSEGKKEKGRGKTIGKTFVKAFIPKVDKSKAYDEADKIFKDQDYKTREQKFGGHFFQLQIVMRDFEQYLEAVTDHYTQLNQVNLSFITICEVAPSVSDRLESQWRRWAMAHMDLQNKALDEHKNAVRARALKPIGDLWEMWVAYQKTIEQRKKFLLYYVKHKQAVDRGERVDPALEESARKFTTINDTLKHELPLLYERTKVVMRTVMTLFLFLQKDWYKTCSKKILPLLEKEPQHTTGMTYDTEAYEAQFKTDYAPMQEAANRLAIVNRNLLTDISNMTSPIPTISSEGGASSRNSTSRRTESMGSEASMLEARNRNSGGYAHGQRSQLRAYDHPPRSSPAGPAYPSLYQNTTTGRPGPGPTSLREARALSPISDHSDLTSQPHDRRPTAPARDNSFLGLDGAFEISDDRLAFDFPPQLGASFLSPTGALTSVPMTHSLSAPSNRQYASPTSTSNPPSLPGSSAGPSRASAIFSSALPMPDSPLRSSAEDLPFPTPNTPNDFDDPEVLFLAASLFEFNIAHDRREGGIPYLVYVPGEIFDVIGMKGELWLARNQDDRTHTVGWIWEKHFARISQEDA